MPLEWRWPNAKQAGRDPRFICHMCMCLMCNVHSRRREFAQRFNHLKSFQRRRGSFVTILFGFRLFAEVKDKIASECDNYINSTCEFISRFFSSFTRIKWTGSEVKMVTIARMPCYFNAIRFEQKMHWHFIVSSIKYRRRIILTLIRSLAVHYPPATNGTHFYYFAHSRIQFIIANYIYRLACSHLRCEYSLSLFCRVQAFRATVSFLSPSIRNSLVYLYLSIALHDNAYRLSFLFCGKICLLTENVAA